MQGSIDPASLVDTVVILSAGILPSCGQFLQWQLVGCIAIHLVGADEHEHCFWTMLPSCFQKVHRAEGIDFEIKNRNVARFVVRGLGGTMHDQVETHAAEQ